MEVFIGANVFLYAMGGEHELRAPCVAVLRLIEKGELDAVTSAEVIQEVLHVVSRRRGTGAATQAGTAVMALMPQVLPVGAPEMTKTIERLQRHPHAPIRDLVHAATAICAGISQIASADADFDVIVGISRVDPAVLAKSGG